VFPNGTLDCTGASQEARWALDAVKQAGPATSTANAPTVTPNSTVPAPAAGGQESRAPLPATAAPDRTPTPPGAADRTEQAKKEPWWKFW
jgi:hypothetical protein